MKLTILFACVALLCSAVSFGSVAPLTREEATEDFSVADDTATLAWTGNTPVITLPTGETQWTAKLTPSFNSDRMRISYYKAEQCPASPYVTAYVRNATTGVWHETKVVDGYDYFTAMTVDHIWFKFRQPYYGTLACRFKLEFRSATTGENPPPTGQEGEVLAGVISFAGGYAPGLSLKVPAATAIKSFRIANPSFCSADVLEAGTVTEGIYDPAKLVEKNERVFSVNQGYGTRVSEIRVSLNGPVNVPCSLPVYVRTAQE